MRSYRVKLELSSQEIEVLLVIKLFWRISIKRRME